MGSSTFQDKIRSDALRNFISPLLVAGFISFFASHSNSSDEIIRLQEQFKAIREGHNRIEEANRKLLAQFADHIQTATRQEIRIAILEAAQDRERSIEHKGP